ncbi:rRNA maturation RNase YbeY [Candidatus Berkelbacteria bacterium CG_4_9_14_3_um_filter_39_23]|uniref:rRNA maturation RNase YbeY n=2 Tax=Candidatus Berkelbacteria TaxID=1618330 RepID=A0A2M7CHI7_9BACT|nr:rRNA maturation RNase YbeY [Candidatus Berkelbacteria bacterium]OIP05624.1 MAG: rRNA maturation RNase YbeY [Candidatus Berkelbacteria bacterium CG2_30_39_44]PIR27784.1 MAG: rRNA maturation RNase YbeY [Candidatus Berkelbacteria bacterium CG11_big_fil_rev_8_21_14_0_20_40_23]PIV25099.1 MAG: rRNA maturation RNase YbeY [Candidatus Berkelbacteria bacterium CG03_land_8_20_14_0_80_40_36]PIX30912.1 MAG: rRNA maturation RNase YbeY [Candidatus Berkelbacteria bacterium CG_4_8_14_3_um_filter_39_27]PIZ28
MIYWHNRTKYNLTQETKSKTGQISRALLADSKKHFIIDVSIVSRTEIKKLNQKYRQKDQATDVLSFSVFNNLSEIAKIDAPALLGEIVICADFVKIENDLTRLFEHGLNHLIGKHHQE